MIAHFGRKKISLIKQRDSMQCGIACLAMICQYYGRKINLDELEYQCGVTNQGVSMLGLKNTAESIGLMTYSASMEIEELRNINVASILHWDQNHFVVLYKIDKKNRYYIADPAKGLITISESVLKKHWISDFDNFKECGIIMSLIPTDKFNVCVKNNRNHKFLLNFILDYIKQYKRYFGLIFFSLLVGSVLQLIMPFLTQSVVDLGIKYKDINLIWLILLGELMIVIGRTSLDFVRRWLLLHISMRINILFKSDFFIKLLKLPMSFFDTKLMGDLLQRIEDHSRVQSFLTNQALSVIFTLLTFIVFGIVLFLYDKVIFFIFFIGSFFYGLWIAHFLKRRKILDYDMFEQKALNQNKTYQFVTTIQEIKLQGCEVRRRWEWEDIQVDLFDIQMKILKLQQSQEAGSVFINEIKNILITVFAATAVINGHITLGAMLAIQYIVGQLNYPVEQIMNFVYSFQDVKISLERINEIHKMSNEINVTNKLSVMNGEKSIYIENIDFKYDKFANNKTLDNISFLIPEGKVTAIVGSSGSGKTTLIKLMLGYYPVISGKIKVSGININNYNLKWWRKQCGVVLQDGVIFSESIARNIAIDDNEIDFSRLEQAAIIANIHDYIGGLPLKYNTIIGRDGVGLSQGQIQRILIARVVYKNPDFIFLDEATNALDANNEKSIVENLSAFYKGRTVIVVAHRLSTVKNADQIIVLDSGKVVEIGNHFSLVKKRGPYYNLVKNQLELGV